MRQRKTSLLIIMISGGSIIGSISSIFVFCNFVFVYILFLLFIFRVLKKIIGLFLLQL